MGWGSNAPESDLRQMFHSRSMREGGDNFIQWKSEEADRLLDEAIRTLDREARMKIWHAFGEIVHDEQPYTFIRVQPWIRLIKREVANVNAYKTSLEPWEFFMSAGGTSVPKPAS
jgi:peptide/nickel transport system substrate-binding protein